MVESLEIRILQTVQDILRENSNEKDIVITLGDSMETVVEWDSLTFMKVFLAINEAFEINPDFDDAIHYTSVKSLHDYLRKQVA